MTLLVILLLLIFAVAIILYKKMNYWFFSYLHQIIFSQKTSVKRKPVEVIFCVADHFEPGVNAADSFSQNRIIERWLSGYPGLADKHRDSDGIRPRHTWFFCAHDDKNGNLEKMLPLCEMGYGEIELHLHHDHIQPVPDTAETLKKKINDLVERWGRLGIFGKDKKDGLRKFGFIHGDWALDNSRGGRYCGVNNELQVLSGCGCYADFTFPSLCESQPKKINAIYYAKDDPLVPKSYNSGIDVRRGCGQSGDLMIVEGPLGLRFKKSRFFIGIEAGNISKSDVPTKKRIDFWVRSAIAVKGKPEWLFIKVHTHGAFEANADVILGGDADKMFEYLEKKYNDGKDYRLHYVTAREMYNIIKAAEDGLEGDPGRFRDYLVARPKTYADSQT